MIALMPIYVKKLIKEISNVKNFGQKQVSVVKAEFFNRLNSCTCNVTDKAIGHRELFETVHQREG